MTRLLDRLRHAWNVAAAEPNIGQLAIGQCHQLRIGAAARMTIAYRGHQDRS
jgi:hypothetical protein